MTTFIAFWIFIALCIVIGDLIWIVFLKRGPSKEPSNELHDKLFEKND